MTQGRAPVRRSTGDQILDGLDGVPSRLKAELRSALTLVTRSCTAGEPSSDELARLRKLGVLWAKEQAPLDLLLPVVRRATENAVATLPSTVDEWAVARARVDGAAFIRELLGGVQEAYESEAHADGCAIITARWAETPPHDYDVLLEQAFAAAGAQLTAVDGCLVAAAADERQAVDLCRRAHAELGVRLWLAVSWRPRTQIGAGAEEAASVLALARCSGRRPGVYGVSDLVVEYAVLRDQAARSCLVELITPVVRQDDLRTTLLVYIEENSNRAATSDRLGITRGGLYLRLNRIERLTGHSPTSPLGMQHLALALGTYRALHDDEWSGR